MPSSLALAALPDHERKRRRSAHLLPGQQAFGRASARSTKYATADTAGAG